MDTIIEECNIDGLMAYQDDLIAGSNLFEETIYKLNVLFKVLENHNLTLFAAKCSFHQNKMKYLGFEVLKK